MKSSARVKVMIFRCRGGGKLIERRPETSDGLPRGRCDVGFGCTSVGGFIAIEIYS